MQTAVMAAYWVTPVFFQEQSVQNYWLAMFEYHEMGSCGGCKALFIREYEHTIKELQGLNQEQLEAQERVLEKIRLNRGG